jgi:hypothetical protein
MTRDDDLEQQLIDAMVNGWASERRPKPTVIRRGLITPMTDVTEPSRRDLLQAMTEGQAGTFK